MPIRLKIIIMFIVSILVSVGVVFITLMGVLTYTVTEVSEALVDGASFDEVFFESIDILTDIKYANEYDPEKMLDPEYIKEMDEKLEFYNSGLIVKYKNEYINPGDLPKDSEFYSRLIAPSVKFNHMHEEFNEHRKKESGEIDNGSTFEYGGHYYFYFGVEFDKLEEQVQYYIIVNIDELQHFKKSASNRFFMIVVIFLIIMSLPIYLVIQKDVVKPLRELEKGAIRISEGNLDVPIQTKKRNEVGKVIETFDLMRIELKKSIERQIQYEENRKELITSISHDLKTPMTSIKGYVEGIIDGVANSDEKREKYLKVIHQKSLDMDKLIDDLFLFSKLDLNRVPFDKQEVNMKNYMQDVVDELSYEYREQLDIRYEYLNQSESSSVISIDAMQLKRVFTNIIVNSIKYNDKHRKWSKVRLVNNDKSISIYFEDNGNGMDNEHATKVFDRFYRIDQSRNTGKGGSGLGLSIAKQIIEQHQGTINASSRLNDGTTIIIELPK